MAVLRLATPFWTESAFAGASAPRFRTLSRSLEADVVIVGGGVTGAMVAWKLAASGVAAIVLEAQRIGRGSTAASTALLMQEPDEDLQVLRERYSSAHAERIWHIGRQITAELVSTLARLRIRCDLERRDSIYYTLDDRQRLGRERALRHAASLGGRWLDADALHRATGFRGAGAIRTRGDAQADPYRMCVGFIDRAVQRGARVFEYSPVRRTTTSSDGVVVETPRGRVRARHLIVATGYATPDFKPLQARFRMMHTYVVATERLPRPMRRAIGLCDVMVWDTERPYHYARWTSDGRLLFGGGDRPEQHGAARLRALHRGIDDVCRYFTRLYPMLRDVRFDYAWEGLFATTPDGLPYIGPHRRYPHHLFALGYGGNGMTFGYLAATLLAERLAGRVTADHDLFAFNRERLLHEAERGGRRDRRARH